jgi:hypothetical protein
MGSSWPNLRVGCEIMGQNCAKSFNRTVPVPTLRAELAAKALALRGVVPGIGTIVIVSCGARVVLFRTVHAPAHRVSAKWPGIVRGRDRDKI